MRKYAALNNNIVIAILDLEDNEYSENAKKHDLLIDINDITPEPQIGWVLNGNKLENPNTNLTPDEYDKFQQTTQRKFGQQILIAAVDKVGARNLKLARDGTPANVAALGNAMASIKLLLEGGALKTARDVCSMIKPAHPNHEDILQSVVDEINAFIIKNNF